MDASAIMALKRSSILCEKLRLKYFSIPQANSVLAGFSFLFYTKKSVILFLYRRELPIGLVTLIVYQLCAMRIAC